MKLHLPKSLLTAVLAICLATGSTAYGLTVATGEYTGNSYNFSTNADTLISAGWTKDDATDIWSYTYDPTVERVTQDFILNYSAINKGDQHVIYITSSESTSWGINTNEAGNALTGCWSPETRSNNGRYTDKDGSALSTVDTSSTLTTLDTDSDGIIILQFETNKYGSSGGTYLYDDISGTKVYDGGGLSTNAAGNITTLNINSAYVSGIAYDSSYKATVTAGSWHKEYNKSVQNKIANYAVDATILNNGSQKVGYESNAQAGANGLAQAGDIIIGGSGQLYLQTYGGNNSVKTGNDITVSNTIYLGTSTQTTGGLRLATYSGDITLNGNITLIEDAKITKEHNKKSATETPNTVTFDGTVSGDYTLTVAADQDNKKFECVAFNNTVDIKGLNLGSDAEISFNGTTSIDTLSMNSHSLALSGSGNVTLGGGTLTDTIDNTNANLTMSGSWTADSLFIFDNNINAESGYSDGANGYLKNDAVFTIVDNSESGAVTFSGTLTAGSVAREVTTQNGDAVVTLAADNTNYYVNTTVDYAEGSNVANASSIVMNGGTLNLSKALNADATISAEQIANPGKVVVGDNISLSNTSVDGSKGDVVIAGSTKAVYDMGTKTSAANVTFGSEWQGVVIFNTGTILNSTSFDVDAYANGSLSSVEFKGVTGYLGHNETIKTIDANIKLSGDGLKFTDGYSDKNITFNGDFSGEGNLTQGDVSRGTASFTFKGDMSRWNGELRQEGGTNPVGWTWNFEAANEKSTTIANDITLNRASGNMTLNVTNSRDVTMSGIVKVEKGNKLMLTKTGGSKLTVNELSASGGNIVLTGAGENAIEVGTLSIASGKTVTGTADVTVNTKLAVASENAFTLTGALALGDDVSIDLTGLTLQENKLSYTLGTASGGITGSIGMEQIKNLNLGETYKDYTYSITAVDPTAASGIALLAEGGNTNTALVLTLEAATTTLTSLTVTGVDTDRSTNTVLTLTTAENAANAVFGTDLNAVMSDAKWEDIKAALAGEGITLSDEIAITFVGADGTTFDFNGANDDLTAPTITINGEGTQDAQVLSGTPNGTKVGNYVTAYIPEPTSTTLSLLALAALAVRRRRK